LEVRGKTVLEIGSGCGLCGLAAAVLGAKSVVLTDGSPGAIAALELSARDNGFLGVSDASAAGGSGGGGVQCEVRACFLDWRDDQALLVGASDGSVGAAAEWAVYKVGLYTLHLVDYP
jgi:predicted nicotinamide N-methyase